MSFWKDAKVLVTGAHGFTGSHLCRELLRQGAQVRALVKNGGVLSNLNDIRKQVAIYSGDVTDITSLFHAMEGMDYVFNPAALVPILEARQSPQSCLQVNVIGSYNVGYAAMKSGIKKMLHVSTCHVYGNHIQDELPLKETATPRSVDVYSASKYSAEICLRTLVDQGFPIVMTRAFAMYGPGQREHYFIPRVIFQLLNGQAPKLGNGYPTRDYCYIEDIVKGYILALEKGESGEIYHLSSQKEVRIEDLYYLIARLIGTSIEPLWNVEGRTHEIARLYGDSSKARKAFGWEPKVSLEEGLTQTIEWWKNHPELWRSSELSETVKS
jgi:nucleoside-diphosphate-sugar epimerase